MLKFSIRSPFLNPHFPPLYLYTDHPDAETLYTAETASAEIFVLSPLSPINLTIHNTLFFCIFYTDTIYYNLLFWKNQRFFIDESKNKT